MSAVTPNPRGDDSEFPGGKICRREIIPVLEKLQTLKYYKVFIAQA